MFQLSAWKAGLSAGGGSRPGSGRSSFSGGSDADVTHVNSSQRLGTWPAANGVLGCRFFPHKMGAVPKYRGLPRSG
ncbi:hypothetical protein RHECNPAF_1360024 [Rhizobium etli CNPAF512]|nr:hypothetical protein RHECNPAF_1360024 [Rhizobium etli CNPAF512]